MKKYLEFKRLSSSEPFTVKSLDRALGGFVCIGPDSNLEFYHEMMPFLITQDWSPEEKDLLMSEYPVKVICTDEEGWVNLGLDLGRIKGMILLKENQLLPIEIPLYYIMDHSRVDPYKNIGLEEFKTIVNATDMSNDIITTQLFDLIK